MDLADQYFWTWVDGVILQDASNFHTFPPCNAPGPWSHTAEITSADCWGMEDDLENMVVKIVPCDADPGLCYKEYKYCWNGTELIKDFVRSELLQEGECDESQTPITPIMGNSYPCWSSCW
jgi:hypothetical protein